MKSIQIELMQLITKSSTTRYFLKKLSLNLVFLNIFLFLSQTFAQNTIIEIAERCQPPVGQQSVLHTEDFKWGYSLEELIQKSTDIYSLNKRLDKRAYWNNQTKSLYLPYYPERGGDIQISEKFIAAIASHIETAFKNQYINAVFFPDMGHSHLLIPIKNWNQKYSQYEVKHYTQMYKNLFQDRSLEILYHTAEQLQMLDDNKNVLPDSKIQWRHKTRNIVGLNQVVTQLEVLQNPNSYANTVVEKNGYFWWGAGFNISANKEGCFSFAVGNQKYYFDLSMYDLQSEYDFSTDTQ